MKTTITRGDEEIPIEVIYSVSKARRGHRDRFGAQEEPDDDPELEIVTVTRMDTGQEIELTPSEQEAVEQECWEDAEEEADDE